MDARRQEGKAMTESSKLTQYETNWQDELNGTALYRALSEIEQRLPLKEVNRRLAEAEERHSCFGMGAGITLWAGRGVLYSGARQVLIGVLAAGITFGLGQLIGASLAG
jgi:VIT1/CCC1 family predicted Fe2+/Mn2+ transporter